MADRRDRSNLQHRRDLHHHFRNSCRVGDTLELGERFRNVLRFLWEVEENFHQEAEAAVEEVTRLDPEEEEVEDHQLPEEEVEAIWSEEVEGCLPKVVGPRLQL